MALQQSGSDRLAVLAVGGEWLVPAQSGGTQPLHTHEPSNALAAAADPAAAQIRMHPWAAVDSPPGDKDVPNLGTQRLVVVLMPTGSTPMPGILAALRYLETSTQDAEQDADRERATLAGDEGIPHG